MKTEPNLQRKGIKSPRSSVPKTNCSVFNLYVYFLRSRDNSGKVREVYDIISIQKWRV